MTFRLQAVDSDDSTILFDFEDPTGANNPYGVRTAFGLDGVFSLTPPELEVNRFRSSDADGERVMRGRVRNRSVSWPQNIEADSYDDLAAAAGELATIFRRGGTLRWQPEGAEDSRWIDFSPSLAPALLNGQPQDLRTVVSLFDTLHGVPLSLDCGPYLRGTVLRSATNLAGNALLLRDIANVGRPDEWVWASTSNISAESIDADEMAYVFTVATSSTRDLQHTTDPNSVGVGRELAFSFYAKMLAGTVGRARAMIEYLDSADAVIGSAHTGNLTALTSSWGRVFVTHTPSPTGTVRIRVSIRIENSSAASTTIAVRWAQAEFDGVSMFVPGPQGMNVSSSPPASGVTAPIWVHGNAWAPVALKLRSEDNAAKVQEYLVGRRSENGENRIKQPVLYINGAAEVLANDTLTNDTFFVTDTLAASGHAAEVRYTTDGEVYKGRVRAGLPSDPSAMRGTWDVWLRCKAMGAAIHRIQLRWAASLVTTVPNVNDEVELDTTNATTFAYVMKYLGRVAMPYDFDSIQDGAFEVWTKRTSGSTNLRLDELRFVPVDDPEPCAARILAPPRSDEVFLATELETPPVQLIGDPVWIAGSITSGNQHLRLNDLYEGCGTPPNAGSPWPAGHQVITFHFDPATQGGDLTFQVRVVNVTAGATVRGVSVPVTPDMTLEPIVVEFDSVTGQSYQAQVVITARTAGHVTVADITHSTVPFLPQQSAAWTDPETGMVARLNSSDQFIMRLGIEGNVPLWCPPGLSVVYVHAVDIPVNGYEDGESVAGRTWSAGIEYAPRYWA